MPDELSQDRGPGHDARLVFGRLVENEPPMHLHAGDAIFRGREAARRRRLRLVSVGAASVVTGLLVSFLVPALTGESPDQRVMPADPPPSAALEAEPTPPTPPTPLRLDAASAGRLADAVAGDLASSGEVREVQSAANVGEATLNLSLTYDEGGKGRPVSVVGTVYLGPEEPGERPACRRPQNAVTTCDLRTLADGSLLRAVTERYPNGLVVCAVAHFRTDGSWAMLQATNGMLEHPKESTREFPPLTPEELIELIRVPQFVS